MMIETAIVAPVLLLMSMGAFQVSQVVAQQTDLQNAAAQAASIAIASPPDTAEKRTTLRNIVVVSTGLAADQVTVTSKFRCGTATVYENSASSCVGTRVSEFVLIRQRNLDRLRTDCRGAVAIEFAIIGPVMLGMLLGVVQFGKGMQNYTALRSIAAEVARYAVVNAQDAAARSDMTMRDSNAEVEAFGIAVATDAPYSLDPGYLTVKVISVPTRVEGASERTIEFRYNIPSMLGFMGIESIPITYSQSVFIA